MISLVENHITENQLCKRSDKLLLAVSGGLDSVVMTDLFHRMGYQTGLAHCNFKLRDEASDLDEQFVKELSAHYHLPLYVKTYDTKAYATQHKCSIQEAARALRYAWFEEVSKKYGFDYVATAHQLDDQKETLFINLLRGSGISGLKGIPLKRGNIIRPLLCVSRKQIVDYANSHQLSWREDASNASDKYLRNRIRHHLIPAFDALLPEAKNAFLKSLNHLADDDLIMQQLVDEKRRKIVHPDEMGYRLSFEDLGMLQPMSVWLYYLLKTYGFSRDATNDISRAVLEKESGKIFFSNTFDLLVDRQALLIRAKKTNQADEIFYLNETDGGMEEPLRLHLKIAPYHPGLMAGNSLHHAYFDAAEIAFPLTVRQWKMGDRFTPFGMKGSKLLSDYFTDIKISRFEKEQVWILLSGETIIWVVGYRTAEFARVRDTTSHVLVVEYKPTSGLPNLEPPIN